MEVEHINVLEGENCHRVSFLRFIHPTRHLRCEPATVWELCLLRVSIDSILLGRSSKKTNDQIIVLLSTV